MFYPKLACTNLRKNAKTYFPYILSSICTIMTFYSMLFIANNPGLEDMPGGDVLPVFCNLGAIVIGIFATILLFYTNSFLIKRRKKELGLYCILGMEKRHIAKVLFFEVLITAAVSIILGLAAGVLISKLLYLVLLNIMNTTIQLTFSISTASIITTVILFLCIFFLTLLSNLWQIKLTNPINLLRGGQQGEKEPKTKWITSIVGFIMLGIGYGIAVTVKSPIDALGLFFLAVLAVIVGTYCLFIAGSIAILKLLKRNKRFYYKPNNFISISGMIYRMKQNAAGLANICILSTMVLVTVSTTVSLYVGQENILNEQFPRNFIVSLSNRVDDNGSVTDSIDAQQQRLGQMVDQTLAKHSVTAEDQLVYTSVSFTAKRENNTFSSVENSAIEEEYTALMLMTIDDYNQMQGTNDILKSGEAYIFYNAKPYGESSIQIGDLSFQVVKDLDELAIGKRTDVTYFNQYVVVVKDMNTIYNVIDAFYDGMDTALMKQELPTRSVGINITGKDQAVVDAANELFDQVRSELPDASCSSRPTVREEWYALYGGFLFLGLFLGSLFLMATVLIIYYKQISEGYDDHDRFEIMQKVGMSKKEVKKTIHKQIMVIFFLPLVVAVIHVSVAFNVIKRLLFIFGLTDVGLFGICTTVTILVFALVYVIVYALTAKAYYGIVEQR